MVNIKSRGCRFYLNITQIKKYKSVKIFIWVKPTEESKTTKQEFKIYNIKSQKPASLKIVKKVKSSKFGYWFTIELRKIKKFLNDLLSSSSDQNIKIGLLGNHKIFELIVREESDLKVS